MFSCRFQSPSPLSSLPKSLCLRLLRTLFARPSREQRVGVRSDSLPGKKSDLTPNLQVMLAGATVQAIQRRIPYGWGGREPSGYITGVPAVFLSALMGLVGVVALVQPDLMLALWGWDTK